MNPINPRTRCKSEPANFAVAQPQTLSGMTNLIHNHLSISESEIFKMAYFLESTRNCDIPLLIRKVQSMPKLSIPINYDQNVSYPTDAQRLFSFRKSDSPHVLASSLVNSSISPTSIPPSTSSPILVPKPDFETFDDSSNSIAGSTEPENPELPSKHGVTGAIQETDSYQFNSMNSILIPQRTRAFFCREWVFDKILRHLKSSHWITALDTCLHIDELDTVTETATALSGSTQKLAGQDYSTYAQSSRKLALVGGPGSGKTTICRRIVNSQTQVRKTFKTGQSLHTLPLCVQVSAHLLATHFCTVQLQDSLNPVTFVRSLCDQIRQAPIPLAKRFSQLVELESGQYGRYLTKNQIRDSPDEAFRYGILGALHASMNASPKHRGSGDLVAGVETADAQFYPGVRQLFILVDGVDECASQLAQNYALTDLQNILISTETDKHRGSHSFVTEGRKSKTILEMLARNVQHFPNWLMLFVTCRRQNRNVISRTFNGIRRISIDDLHRSAVGHDVQQYLLSRLSLEHKLQFSFRAHMHSDFLGLLRIKSSACLLYLETVLDALSDLWVKPEQLALIPGTLNGLYLWLCQCLFSSNTTKHVSCPTYFPLVRPLLEVLLAAPQPISEQELYNILSAVDPSFTLGDYQARLKLLRTFLVTMTPEEEREHFGPVSLACISDRPIDHTRNIHFFHSSFAEWLLDVKHCTVVYLCDLEHGRNLIEHALEGRVYTGRLCSSSMTALPTPEVATALSSDESGVITQRVLDADQPPKDAIDSVYMHSKYTSDSLQLFEPGDCVSHHVSVGCNDSLVLAARKGELENVRALLENNVDVNQLDEDGWSALRTASWRGHLAIVNLLLSSGADVNLSGTDGRSALRAASWAGHEEIVECLLDAGANVNQQDAEGRSPLIAAAYMGHVGVVEILAQAGADLNHADEDGRTALHVAAFCVRPSETHHEVVSCLLECGANPNVVDCEGITPLLGAARVGNRTVCELCLEADTDVNQADKCGNTALSLAVLGGHTSVVRLLLFWGAAVDAMDSAGRSLLSLAAAIGSGPIVQELLARGLDEAHRDHTGCTPLHLAAAGPSSATSVNCEAESTPEQYCEVIRILLESGAHADATDNLGRTPLLTACECNQFAAVESLLAHSSNGSFTCQSPNRSSTPCSLNSTEPRGASTVLLTSQINRPSLENQTPLRAAALCNNPELVRLLLAAGADPDYQDSYGRTTLYLLALEGMLSMADLLLHTPAPGAHIRPGNTGLVVANPVLSDDEGRCPLHVATWQGHLDMVKLLLQAGTPVDIRDREGRTPLQLAAWQGHASICQVLLEEGNARVDAVCSQGATSLCIAAQEGHANVCSVLLQAGANPFQADSHGRTPYRVALKAGNVEICELLEQRCGSNPSWFDGNGRDSSSTDFNQPRASLDAVPSSADPRLVNQGQLQMSSAHDYSCGAPISLSSTGPMAVFPTSDQPLSVNANPHPHQQQRQQYPNQNPANRNFGDDANPYARPPGPLVTRHFQQTCPDKSLHSESQIVLPSMRYHPDSRLLPSNNTINFVNPEALDRAGVILPRSSETNHWQFTSDVVYSRSPGLVQPDPRTGSFMPIIGYSTKTDTSIYDPVYRSAYHHQQPVVDHPPTTKSTHGQTQLIGQKFISHHVGSSESHPVRASSSTHHDHRGIPVKMVGQDNRIGIEVHRVKHRQQKDPNHRTMRSSQPDSRDSGTEAVIRLPASAVATKKPSLSDDSSRHMSNRTHYGQACYPDLLPHQFHQLQVNRDQGGPAAVSPSVSPSANCPVKLSSSLQPTPTAPAKNISQTPRQRAEQCIATSNNISTANASAATNTTTGLVETSELQRTTEDRFRQRETSLPAPLVVNHAAESKTSSTKSTLVGMLRFGNLRGKKSRKQPTDSTDTTVQSDSNVFRAKLKSPPQSKNANYPPADESHSDMTGVTRLPCIGYPIRLSADGNSTKLNTPLQEHEMPDRSVTSSMQLEALARKLACCTQTDGLPQPSNLTVVSQSQMVPKPYSPQLWDRQTLRNDANRPPL